MGTEDGTPVRTIKLLDCLQPLGFGDDAFARLHHARQGSRRETIGRHRAYCQKTMIFEPTGENVRTQQRLALVLARFCEREGPAGNKELFHALADAAFREIPPRSM